MNDNVIKFRKKETPKPPRQPSPSTKKALVVIGVIAFFVAAFGYFYMTGDPSAVSSGTTLN